MRALGLAAALVALVACQSDPLSPGDEQLNEAELLWLDLAIDNYAIVVTRSLSGAPIQVRVDVTDGVVSARRYVFDDSEVAPAHASLYPDVSGLFALIRDGFARARGARVDFDPIYGFPSRIIINYDVSQVDDDVDISVSGFEDLTAQGSRAE